VVGDALAQVTDAQVANVDNDAFLADVVKAAQVADAVDDTLVADRDNLVQVLHLAVAHILNIYQRKLRPLAIFFLHIL
jgi:hypothetical protein